MNVRDPNTINIMAEMNAANATSCTAVTRRSAFRSRSRVRLQIYDREASRGTPFLPAIFPCFER
jgi:hypothetical protein